MCTIPPTSPHPGTTSDGATTPTRLPLTEHALLWSMRAWVIGMRRQADTAAHIQGALAMAGVPGAAMGALDRFMGALCLGATRQIRIDCICMTAVSDDERLLLDAISLQQELAGNRSAGTPLATGNRMSLAGLALLHQLMDPDNAQAAAAAAARLATILIGAGLRLPTPSGSRPPRSAPSWDEAADRDATLGALDQPHTVH